ncbi:hypothetical protein C8R43DRAFT_73256 [Mycena crocata]|nr:hypothetical protein C8R43DRAFT_73256 [Mycena crocata]
MQHHECISHQVLVVSPPVYKCSYPARTSNRGAVEDGEYALVAPMAAVGCMCDDAARWKSRLYPPERSPAMCCGLCVHLTGVDLTHMTLDVGCMFAVDSKDETSHNEARVCAKHMSESGGRELQLMKLHRGHTQDIQIHATSQHSLEVYQPPLPLFTAFALPLRFYPFRYPANPPVYSPSVLFPGTGMHMRRECPKSMIFITGLTSRYLPMLVTENFTMNDIYECLRELSLVPSIRPPSLYFFAKKEALWEDTVKSLGLKPSFEVEVRMFVNGGAGYEADPSDGYARKRKADTDDQQEGSSTSGGKRKTNANSPVISTQTGTQDLDSDGDVNMDANMVPVQGHATSTSIPTIRPTGHVSFDLLGLRYSPELKIIVCKPCKTGLPSVINIPKHLEKKHAEDTHVRAQLASKTLAADLSDFFARFPLLTPDEFTAFRPHLPTAPIPFLETISEGWVCLQPTTDGPICGYAVPHKDSLRSHKDAQLHAPNTLPSSERQRSAPIQRLCNITGITTRLWPVDLLLAEIPAAGYAGWASGFRKMHPDGIFPRAQVEIGEQATLPPFLQQTGWLSWLNGYSVGHLRALILPAEKGDFWDNVKSLTLGYTCSITEEEFKTVHFGDAQTLNDWKYGRPAFQLLGEATSRYGYSLFLRKALLAIFHVVQQEPTTDNDPVPDFSVGLDDVGQRFATDADILEGEADEEEDEEKEEAGKVKTSIRTGHIPDAFLDPNVDGLDDSLEDPDVTDDEEEPPLTESTNLRTYPVLLTELQRTNALALYQALTGPASQEDRLAKLHALLLSLFCEQIDNYEEKRSSSFVEVLLLAINVLPSGGIRPTVNITPTLSKVQYFILFSILKEAMDRKRRDGILIAKTLDEFKPFFRTDTVCVFAAIRYYQRLGWKEVRHRVGVARALFTTGSPIFQFDGKESSVLDWINMIHQLWRMAERILRDKILMGIPYEDFGFSESDIKDVPRTHAADYGFAASRSTGCEKLVFERLMTIFWNCPAFVAKMTDPEEESKLNRQGCMRWLGFVDEFKRILCFLLLLTAGAPKRMTEMLLHKLFDTEMRSRNIFWLLYRIFMIGDYSKTSRRTGTDKKTVHLVPPAFQPSLIVFLMVAIPLEMYFLEELKFDRMPNSHCYLFSSFGQRWKSADIGKIIRQFTKKYLGQTYGMGRLRHIIPGIIRHYGLSLIDHSGGLQVVAQMQGHTVDVATRLYDVEQLPGTVTSADLQQVVAFCSLYHNFLGLGIRGVLEPRSAENIRREAQGPVARQMEDLAAKVAAVQADNAVLKAHNEVISANLAHATGLLQHLINSMSASVSRAVAPYPPPASLVATNQIETPNPMFTCPECNALGIRWSDVIAHMILSHNRFKQAGSGRVYRRRDDLLFYCSCGCRFSKDVDVAAHIAEASIDSAHPPFLQERPEWGLHDLTTST